jgi:hypothetical protein
MWQCETCKQWFGVNVRPRVIKHGCVPYCDDCTPKLVVVR